MTTPTWITPSGIIANIPDNVSFSYSLLYSGTPSPSVLMIAGSLPPGLSIDSFGIISGTPLTESVGLQYNFVVRIENINGIADRNFTISIITMAPIWSIPSNLGAFQPQTPIDIDLLVNDLSNSIKTFQKISGELPEGLSLNEFGKLYGATPIANIATTYSFDVRCNIQGIGSIDQTFLITVDPLAPPQPVWITTSGILANINAGEPFNTNVLAIDPLGGTVTYSALGLPSSLSINSLTGVISGVLASPLPYLYAFPITAIVGINNVSRIFELNANNLTTYPISWSTPAGDLGSILEGEKSTIGVRATSESRWIRYELYSGSLPAGLSIDPNTGDIWGIVEEQVALDVNFTFEVKAYSDSTFVIREFSITVINNYSPGATRTFVTVYGIDKLIWIDLFATPEILHGSIYREGDAQYGLIETPKIILTENLDNPLPDSMQNILSGVRRTYLNLGHVEVAKAYKNGELIYEVLYRRIFDDSAGALQEFTDPTTLQIVKPGSLSNIRNRLLKLGVSGGNETLPLWMQQSGWFPCIAFAHVLPNTGQSIADRINTNDQQLKKLYQNRVRVDRLIVEPAADTSFAPYFLLFDGKY